MQEEAGRHEPVVHIEPGQRGKGIDLPPLDDTPALRELREERAAADRIVAELFAQ